MTKRRLPIWLYALLLLIAAGCIGYLGTRHARVFDWSSGDRASLTAPTRAVLQKLHGPVQITSYAAPGGKLRPTIAAFLQRYQAVKPDISVRFVDPDKNPAAMRAAGIEVAGEMVLRYDGRTQHVRALSEDALTNAMERLTRDGDRIVAFVTGDGERRADSSAGADLGLFIKPLAARGVRAVPLNFSQVGQVPQGTRLVVLASPQSALPKPAVQALVDYVRDGGNLLWLSDPGQAHPELDPLAHALGVQRLPGLLVDGQGAALGLNDPRIVALGSYPPTAITKGLVQTTVFAQVQALASISDTEWSARPLLRSSPKSWTELQPIDDRHPSTIRFDPAKGELRGPLDFGFALSRLSPSPDKNEQRAVVIGDGDFLSNAFLGQAGNRALGERVFEWLLGDDALIGVDRAAAPDRVVHLSRGGLTMMAAVFMIGLPLLLLLLGTGIAWRRRRR
ncbi:Gldg family protein [Oleiagrimonas citrea]|jgi:ABC-type uncharacterized transport system involved in gliding motility auxiliary subunit|uniref:GldG family protein n=1 Tax=Oleiagrimonas citrea TaxID=1665687 RepID=A0A846ZR53_9GAMM|nr:DUF4350 domain-containing protein [Oleiagrimonas citrea]NKZ40018.1 GldG family protein [Oleiagrimonas citrea]